MASGHRAENTKYTSIHANPKHPDLEDPYREIRKLMRPMRPNEEAQRPYDFGNVNQAQLAVDGYAARVAAAFNSGARSPKYDDKYRNGNIKEKDRSAKSQATRPDGWQTTLGSHK